MAASDEAKKALEGVTPGRAVQFHPSYCKEAEGMPFGEWDTSHDLSVIRADGSRYKIAHFRHADDAMFDQWCRNNVPALLAENAAKDAEIARLREALAHTADQALAHEIPAGYGPEDKGAWTKGYDAAIRHARRALKGDTHE